eukprot:g5607.t1
MTSLRVKYLPAEVQDFDFLFPAHSLPTHSFLFVSGKLLQVFLHQVPLQPFVATGDREAASSGSLTDSKSKPQPQLERRS